jgi:putative transposase
MPKYARKHQLSDSLVYHVYNRGNGRNIIFHDSADYGRFISLLRIYTARFYVKIYHWVLMPNHFHLLLEIADPRQMSKLLAGLTVSYTRYHHGVHHSCGFLWQGRFQSQAVQKESYLIACGRYIERNPVKAGIVRCAEGYEYSSARFYCFGFCDGLTSESPEYNDFGSNALLRQESYKKFLSNKDQDNDELWDDMEKPRGTEEFMKKLVKTNGRILPRRAGRHEVIIDL